MEKSILLHAMRRVDCGKGNDSDSDSDSSKLEAAWFIIKDGSFCEVFQDLQQPEFCFTNCAMVGDFLYVIGGRGCSKFYRLDTGKPSEGWKEKGNFPIRCSGMNVFVVGRFIYCFPSSLGTFKSIDSSNTPWGLFYDTKEEKFYPLEPPCGLVVDCPGTPPSVLDFDNPLYRELLECYDESRYSTELDELELPTREEEEEVLLPNDESHYLCATDTQLLLLASGELFRHTPAANDEWEHAKDDFVVLSQFHKYPHRVFSNGVLYMSNFDILTAYSIDDDHCRFLFEVKLPPFNDILCPDDSCTDFHLIPVADSVVCFLWVKSSNGYQKDVLCYAKVSVSGESSTVTIEEEKVLGEIDAHYLLGCLPMHVSMELKQMNDSSIENLIGCMTKLFEENKRLRTEREMLFQNLTNLDVSSLPPTSVKEFLKRWCRKFKDDNKRLEEDNIAFMAFCTPMAPALCPAAYNKAHSDSDKFVDRSLLA